MSFIGSLLMMIAMVLYFKTWQAIRRLVNEANRVSPPARYSLLWWLPAWKVHARVYSTSSARRNIVVQFLLTFVVLSLSGFFLFYESFAHIALR